MIQYCIPVANGDYGQWTGDYSSWGRSGSPPDTSYPPAISCAATLYGYLETAKMTPRATPRVSINSLTIKEYVFKTGSVWNGTGGTFYGGGLHQYSSFVCDTFVPSLYVNLTVTPTDAQLDNYDSYQIAMRYDTGDNAYCTSGWLQMDYVPAGGSFVLILSSALAAIGANVLLREMPALARHLWRSSRGEHWMTPADYELVWGALRNGEIKRPAWSF